jgi:hypothetical protein
MGTVSGTIRYFGTKKGINCDMQMTICSHGIPLSLGVLSMLGKSIDKIIKKASKGHKTPSEAFTSASFGNPLSWLSPRRLRVKSD